MKLFGTVILFTLFFIVQPNPSLGTEISESSSSLYFSENPIKFDPPIIKKINTYFLPVRELVRLFDGTIRRSNINLDYTITINNQKYNIKPNVPTYQLNNQKKTFPSPPIVYKTRLYVPMESFLKNLNFKLIKKNNHFYAYSSNSSTIEQQTIPLDYTHTETKKTTKMYLPISNITLPITPIIVNGKKKTDLTEFIRILGYKLETIDRYFLIKKNNTIYSFKNGSNQVKISDKNIIKTKKLNYTPTIKNGRFYIPLAPFLNDLGFDYLEQNNTIIILKKLNHIAINDHLNLTLNKNSKIKINQGHQLSNPNRIYWDLGTTKCPNKAIQTKMNSVKTITFGQKNTTCRMVFHLNDSFKTSISKISNQDIKFTFKKTTPKAKTSTTITAMQPISPPIQKPRQIASKKIKYRQTLKGKTIIIDPGHGGADPGAVNKSNDYEKYYTLDISKRMKRELEKKGAKVILLRTKDTNPSLYQRVRKINKLKGDFLISVHVNSFINGAANGSETYYYKKNEKLAAKYVQKHLAKTLKLKNNGIKHAKMYILKYSKTPGVLIEPCFLTNTKEYQLLKTTAFRNKIATATVAGLDEYYKNK